MQKIKKYLAFTLVELIVVIIILTILGTVAFLSLNGYTKTTRDTIRISDISKIERSLESFKLQAAVYPEPTNGIEITYNGFEVWTQGTFGVTTFTNVSTLDKIPLDPYTEIEYTYSVTNDRREFQIASILETGDISYNELGKTYAENEKEVLVKVVGDYNGQIVKVYNGLDLILLATPSIIGSELTTFDNLVANDKLVYNGYKNLPASYIGTGFKVLGETEPLNIVNKDKILLYSGKEKDLLKVTSVSQDGRTSLVEKIKQAYTGTKVASKNEITDVLFMNTTDNDLVNDLVSNILQEKIGKVNTVSSVTNLNCVGANHSESKDFWSTSSVSHTSGQVGCDNAKKTFICQNGEYVDLVTQAEKGVYSYNSCVVGIPINCNANPSYVYNGHSYNIPAITHAISNTITSTNFSENNGVYTYDLTIECSDGILLNPNESESSLTSCSTGFHTEDNSTCIINTKQLSCIESGAPVNSNYNVTNVDVTWNGNSWNTASNCTWTCNTNYTSDGSSCNADSRDCTIADGAGTQIWNGFTWSSCNLESCDSGFIPVGNECLGGWMAVDTNCDKTDITIGGQTWAGCNSTLGTGVEFTETSLTSCVAYGVDASAISTTCNSTQNASDSKANAWNATYGVDNIWGKLYTGANAVSACSSGYHLPTIWEYNELLRNLGCGDTLNDTSKWYLCNGIGWNGYQSKSASNNIVQALGIPLSGNRLVDGVSFENRGLGANIWTNSLDDSNRISLSLLFNNNSIGHSGINVDLANSVRCIKDGSTPSITTNDNQGYFYVQGNELQDYDIKGGASIIIPSIVDSKNISSIGDNVFMNFGITSVSIPSTVTSIGYRSFYGNNLTTVTIPNSVTSIGEEAFAYNSSLGSVTLGSSLTDIGIYSFYGDALTSLTVPASVNNIGEGAFRFNEISSLTLNEGLETIGDSAFDGYIDEGMTYGNSISSLTIPSTVTSIGDYAFSDNVLTSITIPESNSITYIGEAGFGYQGSIGTVYGPTSGYVLDTYTSGTLDEFDTANLSYEGHCSSSQVWDTSNNSCVTPQVSCSHIKIAFPEASDGIYWIDPDGTTGEDPFKVYCDMTTDGGGWTAVVSTWNPFYESQHSSNVVGLGKYILDNNTINFNELRYYAERNGMILDLKRVSNTLSNDFNRSDYNNQEFIGNNNYSGVTNYGTTFTENHDFTGNSGQIRLIYRAYEGYDEDGFHAVAKYESVGVNNADLGTYGYVYTRNTDFTYLPAQNSCTSHRLLGRTIDGTYSIDPDGAGGNAAFDVYCDMTTDGGGWSLILKINSDDTGNFSYGSSLWSGNTPLNETDFNLDTGNSLYNSYFHLKGNKLKLNIAEEGDIDILLDESNTPKYYANNQYTEVMYDGTNSNCNWADNEYRNANWYLQKSAYVRGTNIPGKVKFGIYAENVKNPISFGGRDSGVGIGISGPGGSLASGNVYWSEHDCASSYGSDIGGSRFIKSKLWLKSSNFTDLPTQTNCNAHKTAGMTISGQYMIDPDGTGGAAAYEVTCDMENDTQTCDITNGTGIQTWNGSSYGTCTVDSCNEGYIIDGNGCIEQPLSSLRFNDDDSASLSRTPSSAGNRKTWTWSGWVKRGNIGENQILFDVSNVDNNFRLMFKNDNLLLKEFNSTTNYKLISSASFRDISSWYHIVLLFDTTQIEDYNRIKIYVNGNKQLFSTATFPTLDSNNGIINSTITHKIGTQFDLNNYLDGYLSQVNFIDGQALTPSDFAYTDSTTGQYLPKNYTGTYGTNGFHLAFNDSSDIGKDSSGNSNTWTVNNIDASDVVLDSPKNNYAVLNPINKGSVFALSEGNLKAVVSGSTQSWAGININDLTNNHYIELYLTNMTSNQPMILIGTDGQTTVGVNGSYGVTNGNGLIEPWNDMSAVTGDIISLLIDRTNNTISYYKNNIYIGNKVFPVNGIIGVGTQNGASGVFNFGQDSTFAGNKTEGNYYPAAGGEFAYEPPAGFKALSTNNLPEPSIVDPGEHFDVVTWTGTNTLGGKDITGLDFQPDMVWSKGRDTAYLWNQFDSVRGPAKRLSSNSTNAESINATYGYLSSFNSNGFSTSGGSTNNENWNETNKNYVAWNWKAGGSAVTNTDGSITSQVSANTEAGFSIVGYTGNGVSGNTIGHGLSTAPELLFIKNRTSSTSWAALTTAVDGSDDYMFLNTTDAKADNSLADSLDTTTFKVGSGTNGNGNGANHIAYVFHSVPGYSKVGSYTGNGSADGPFVYTGFKPKYVMVKAYSKADPWWIIDSVRSQTNEISQSLRANDAIVEADDHNANYDFLSNGFKARTASGQNGNESGTSYIYIAFAEKPFKYASAR